MVANLERKHRVKIKGLKEELMVKFAGFRMNSVWLEVKMSGCGRNFTGHVVNYGVKVF